MESLLKKNQKKIGQLLAVSAVFGVGVYFLAKKFMKQPESVPPAPNSLDTSCLKNSSFLKSADYQQKVETIRILLNSQPKNTPKTKIITAIIQLVVDLYKTKFTQLYLNNRIQRRSVISNKTLYAQLVAEGSQEGEQLFEEATLQVISDIEWSYEEYNAEVEQAAAQDPAFMKYVTYLYSSVKVRINEKQGKQITADLLVQFFQLQIDVLNQGELREFDGLELNQSLMCKQTFLGDVAAVKLGFEEEEIAMNLELLNRAEVIQKQNELTEKLKGSLGMV